MPSRLETEVVQRYRERHAIEASVTTDLERAVLGTDYGANGYTTRAQAEELEVALPLRGGRRLLDVGSGCGWPGLYLASRTGCAVLVSDIPLEGLRRARTRSLRDGLGGRAWVVATGAAQLSFAPATFDAIVHTDVLC